MTQLLFAPFVSNDPTQRLLVASSSDGQHWSGGDDTNQKTTQQPAMTYFNGRYYIFFTTADQFQTVLLITSTDGTTWSTQQRVGTSNAVAFSGPTVTLFQNKIWLAFLSKLNPSEIVIGSRQDQPSSWTSSSFQIPNNTSTSGGPAPRLAGFQDKLWMTFVNQDQVFLTSSSDGIEWSTPLATGLYTVQPASIVSYFDKLFISVQDRDTTNIMLVSSADGVTWTPPITTPLRAQSSPTFAIFNQRLWMSYIDRHRNNNVQVAWSPEGTTWSVNVAVNQQSPFSPTLCSQFSATGTVSPSYQIVTVVYAPPGTQGGGSGSMIEYGTGSSLTTVVSNTKAFKEGTTISTSVGIGGSSVGAEFGVTSDASESNSLDIKKSATWNLQVTGPAVDGIHHGYDLFYLWLNPQLRVFATADANFVTELGVNGPTMNIQYVYATWLENPDTMPPGLKTVLTSAGFTDDDYKSIRATNPLTNPFAPFDTTRYIPTTQSFPYIPPISKNDKTPSITYTQQSVLTKTKTQTSETSYLVSYKITNGVKLFIEASLSNEKKFQWTNSSVNSSSTTTTQQATVTVAGPSFDYTGPTDVLVYWDTIFSSFAFRFPDTPPTYTGALADSSGNPIAAEPVSLHVDGNELTTHTDAQGGFRFYNTTSPNGEVAIRGNKTPVTLSPNQPSAQHTV